jgi:hypothetical protein
MPQGQPPAKPSASTTLGCRASAIRSCASVGCGTESVTMRRAGAQSSRSHPMNPARIREATLDDALALLDMMEAFNAFERIP